MKTTWDMQRWGGGWRGRGRWWVRRGGPGGRQRDPPGPPPPPPPPPWWARTRGTDTCYTGPPPHNMLWTWTHTNTLIQFTGTSTYRYILVKIIGIGNDWSKVSAKKNMFNFFARIRNQIRRGNFQGPDPNIMYLDPQHRNIDYFVWSWTDFFLQISRSS